MIGSCTVSVATEILKHFAGSSVVLLYADLPGMQAKVTAPRVQFLLLCMFITSYRPDLVIYNQKTNSIVILELTCPLDSSGPFGSC